MMLLYALAIVVIINCGFYLLFSKFSFHKTSEEKTLTYFPVSLIICAKNEAENLKNNLPSFLKQDHPNFEIILINDASSDDTLEIMEQFQEQDDRIQIVNVENNEAFWGYKKYALTLGIKRAKNKCMIFTDADCVPASSQWLAIMASKFSTEKQLVLGYGGYKKRKGLLNMLIRFETVLTATQYFSYAKAGIPYMGVGRNLAYTSNLYYANNGFISHIKLASGDDDLFVNETATGTNTAICTEAAAFTYSTPKETWNAWFHQKRRHISTAKFYKPKHKFLLTLYYLANLLFWGLAVASLLILNWQIPTLIIALRLLLQWIVIGMSSKKLKEKDIIYLLPLLDLFLLLVQLSIFISNTRSKPSRWK